MEFPLLTVMSLCPQEHKEHVHTDLEVTTKARDTSWVCASSHLGLCSRQVVKGILDLLPFSVLSGS